MAEKSKYKTRQREQLIAYLESMPGTHFTAADACNYFKAQGSNMGQSTIYRQLETLVDEGILNKYIIDTNSPACFEYVGAHSHGKEICFHCKCEKCGKLIHLHCHELNGIQAHLLEDHGFRLNPMRTVFYGRCEDCQED